MFRSGLLLITWRYYSVFTVIFVCHGFMLTGYWQDPLELRIIEVPARYFVNK